MRLLLLGFSIFALSGCGSTLQRAEKCEEKFYLGCPVGKLECVKDAKGCKQCQCVL